MTQLTRWPRSLLSLLTLTTLVLLPTAHAQNEQLPMPQPQTQSDAQPPLNAHLLVFSRTAGYRHSAIPTGIETLRQLGESHGFTLDATEDPAAFTDDNLAAYDAVVFLNTTGDVLGPAQQAAFERYIRSGRAFVGIHSAADTEYDWPWYGRLVGTWFKSHPKVQPARCTVARHDHPATAHLGDEWLRTDEWYDFRAAPEGVDVLIRLDESTYEGGQMGKDHPITWAHTFDGGRAFYTAMGHTEATYAEPAFRQLLVGALRWATATDDNPARQGADGH